MSFYIFYVSVPSPSCILRILTLGKLLQEGEKTAVSHRHSSHSAEVPHSWKSEGLCGHSLRSPSSLLMTLSPVVVVPCYTISLWASEQLCRPCLIKDCLSAEPTRCKSHPLNSENTVFPQHLPMQWVVTSRCCDQRLFLTESLSPG